MYNPEVLQDNLLVTFRDESVYQSFRSKEEGEAVYEDQLYVEIKVPFKENDSIYRPANTDDERKYPAQYQAYVNQEKLEAEGTVLQNWNYPSESQIKMLLSHSVRTVEQVAALDDIAAKRMGNGGRSLRDTARKFVEQTQDTVVFTDEIKELKATIKELTATNKALEKENTKYKEAEDDTIDSNTKRSKSNGASSSTS